MKVTFEFRDGFTTVRQDGMPVLVVDSAKIFAAAHIAAVPDEGKLPGLVFIIGLPGSTERVTVYGTSLAEYIAAAQVERSAH